MYIASKTIFEFLGLPETHRKGQKITQHVKHFDEVPESKMTWPLIGQIKKDGVYALVAKVGYRVQIFSRTGKKLTNVSHLERYIENHEKRYMIAPAVYIAELCCDDCALEVLSGIVNPNRKKDLSTDQKQLLPLMYLAYHDVIYHQAFKDGTSPIPYSKRLSWLRSSLTIDFKILDTTLLLNKEEVEKFAAEAIARGEEGVVLKRCLDEPFCWVAGHKGYRVMKKVRQIDYDLLCIGAEEGKGKYKGLVANLIFQWKDGNTIKCMLGKGWTHEMAEEMWNYYTYGEHIGMREHNHKDGPVGKIFQVYALQESSKGKLRLPKVGELRHDKCESDIKKERE